MSGDYLEAAVDKFILRVMKGLRYSRDHVWVRREGGQCTLGLTDFAQRRGGDIVFLEFPKEKGVLVEGEPVALYETIKVALEVRAPFPCEILERNGALEVEPEHVNEDPYGKGWVAKVKPAEPGSVESLLSPEDYFELMMEEIEDER